MTTTVRTTKRGHLVLMAALRPQAKNLYGEVSRIINENPGLTVDGIRAIIRDIPRRGTLSKMVVDSVKHQSGIKEHHRNKDFIHFIDVRNPDGSIATMPKQK